MKINYFRLTINEKDYKLVKYIKLLKSLNKILLKLNVMSHINYLNSSLFLAQQHIFLLLLKH